MKQPIRYFSVGLITASLILFIFIFFTNKPAEEQASMKIDDMITDIKNEGYHVLSASEYINLITIKEQSQSDVESDESKNEDVSEDTNSEQEENQDDVADQEDNSAKEDKDNDKPTIHSYTLNVKPNMLGLEISRLLAKNKIIDDADAFNRYLEVEGYAPYIQLGKHKLTSEMTNYQLAEKIANKKE